MDVMSEADRLYMKRALELAGLAAQNGDVPVGAVIVCGDKIVAEGYNERVICGSATAHAEVLAIERACRAIGSWRLSGCTLYVTLEPCPMCAGAIINSRIDRVVFGAKDAKAGCFGSLINFNSYPFNHKPTLTEGVLAEECARLLSEFFGKRR